MRMMPTEVLMMMGQMAVMKMTNTAEGSALLKVASEMGSQASGGMVRRTWKMGSKALKAIADFPMMMPSKVPTTAARLYPSPTRFSEEINCQPRPLSLGPLSNQGWAM